MNWIPQKVPIGRLQGIFPFGGFSNLAIKEAGSALHLISIRAEGYLRLGEESLILFSFSYPLADHSCF